MKHIAFIGLARSGIDGEIMRGIVGHSQVSGQWQLSDAGHDCSYFGELIDRGLDGVIGNITDFALEQQIIDFSLPAINTSDALPTPRLTSIIVDNQKLGRLAAEHLLERGLNHFAFVGLSKYAFTADRYTGFQERIKHEGGTVIRRIPNSGSPANESERRIQWLKELPKPVGLLASTDSDGWTFVQVCQQAGLSVPDDVAIISCGNDQFTCHLSNPPLTSVGIPGRVIGHRAAEKLEEFLKGGRQVKRNRSLITRIPPDPIAVRQSTNILAVPDLELAEALRHIRSHATQGLNVSELLRVIPLGRRDLERRFQKYLHRTPLDEIRRVRIQEAERLLVTTELTIDKLAERCGYGSVDQFTRAFRQSHGTTPARYRKNHLT